MAVISASMSATLLSDSYIRRTSPETSPLSPIDDQKKSIHPPLSASRVAASTVRRGDPKMSSRPLMRR